MENIYNYTKFTNVSRVKYAVYPLYLTGNIADSTAVHRKPRKKYRPVVKSGQVKSGQAKSSSDRSSQVKL